MIASPTRCRQIMIFAQVPTNQGRRGEGKSLCDDILKKKRGQLEGKLTSRAGLQEPNRSYVFPVKSPQPVQIVIAAYRSAGGCLCVQILLSGVRLAIGGSWSGRLTRLIQFIWVPFSKRAISPLLAVSPNVLPFACSITRSHEMPTALRLNSRNSVPSITRISSGPTPYLVTKNFCS